MRIKLPALRVCLSCVLVWVIVQGTKAESDYLICRDGGHVYALAEGDEGGSSRQYAPDRHVDILHLRLDVTPDFERQTVAGTATITFSPIGKPLRELRLDGRRTPCHCLS